MKNDMKLSVRLGLGFSVLMVLMMIIILITFININQITSSMDKIVSINTYKLNLYNDLDTSLLTITRNIRSMLLTADQDGKQQIYEEIKKEREKYDKTHEKIYKTATSEKGMAIRAKIDEAANMARPLNTKVMDLALANKQAEAIQIMNDEAGPADQQWQDALDESIAFVNETNRQDADAARQGAIKTLIFITVIGMIIFIAGIIIAIFITRSITKPMNSAVSRLNEGAQQVAAASSQLSASAQQLSQGSSEQASAIEETSSTLQESASMLQQNTANTKQAAQLADQAKESANKGNNEMQEMMASMQEIKKSSDQIARIIKVIDDIAFQTNILALNAAIEAARAGEAGMGFAVVAEEVRNLAQRSAQAAKDTTAIIEANIELSGKGVAVADRVREALAEITDQAKKVNELMDEISAASQEQAQGVDQVNKAMIQMETVTQQNAANAEESASASEELSAQADNMRKIVSELSQMINGKAGALRAEMENSGHEVHHLTHQSGQTVKTIGTARQASAHLDALHNNTLLTDKSDKKTKVISPEDVIPLEEDSHFFS